jgi:hypothetical protein
MRHPPPRARQKPGMKATSVYWLVAALAVAALTIALAALIVVLMPGDPNAQAAAIEQQVLEPTPDSIAEAQRHAR